MTAFGIAIVGLARAAGAQDATNRVREARARDDGVTRFQHQNQGDIDAYGTETALHTDLGRGWSMRAGHAWSVAESDAGAPLNFPSHLVNGGHRRITDPVVADHKPVVQIDQEPRTLHVAIDYRF